ncbi:MAG: hypothetical protein FWD67_12450 [Betaproteobacteria bacterium]|nr:hypothetical protein [Betaproteobacteria bacterium]
MSRKAAAAATLWLPGFDPEPPEPHVDDSAHPKPEIKGAPPTLLPAPANDLLLEERKPGRTHEWRFGLIPAQKQEKAALPARLNSSSFIGLSGNAAKYDANLAAIEALNRVEAEHRQADEQERRLLVRYCGWGCLPAAFNLDGKETAWADRAQRLQTLLAPNDYESARSSVNNSHYTPFFIVEAIWAAVQRLGFNGGRVLEPAAGTGHFIGAMPLSLAERSNVTAVEIDSLSGRMLRTLYAPSGVDVQITPFEATRFPSHWFDLVIGNVPFGKYKVADTSNRPFARFSIHNYFVRREVA